MKTPEWLEMGRRLQAIAQTGLTFARDPFDIERYGQVRQIAAEIIASGAGLENTEQLVGLFRDQVGYATPKIDVRAAVFDQERILLVRERSDNKWALPGGWADVGDTPSIAVLREIREESGYEAKITKLAAVYDREMHGHPPYPFHAYKLFFVCELTGGALKLSYETTAIDFFEENSLPEMSLARVTPGQVQHMFDHRRHTEWPTSFD